MNCVEIQHIEKAFGATKAVRDVSFSVQNGEIFGLLGPNGAGKTTTIRLILDMLKPDRGAVSVFGGAMTEAKKDRIGYMPEERGLYQDATLEHCLVYLATLKGMSKRDAKRRLALYLDRFDLSQHRRKKIKELSRGMQQKAQIINTILHDPELIIVDEPFSGLDPVNRRMVKELMLELKQQGKSIIMSTHMMHQVQELCDRIVLIDKGQNVLYGDVREIRRQFSGNAILVRVTGELPELQGIHHISRNNGAMKLTLSQETKPKDVLKQLVALDVAVEKFELALPTLDEIFIEAVGEH